MKLTYQPIIREYAHVYQLEGLTLQERGLLLHLYINANPRSGIYMTHARRLAEETGAHVETIRQAQRRLKRAKLIIYKHSQTARLRPYFVSGFILFKHSNRDMHITRSIDDILKQGRKQRIFNNRTTERQVIEFLDRAGETWVNSFFSIFAKKVTAETRLIEAPAVSLQIEAEPDPIQEGNAVSEQNHAARAAFNSDMSKIFGAPPN